MAESLFETVKSGIKNWWVSLILGILFIIFGLCIMFMPAASYVAISVFFAAFMFVSGIFEIYFAISNSKSITGWGWYLASGIIDLVLGGLLLLYPALTMAVIPFIVAFWLMLRGFSAIGISIDFHRFGGKGWGWILAFGILAVICAILVLMEPVIGAALTVYMCALAFLFIGVFRIMLAMELQKVNKRFSPKSKK